MKQFQVIGGGGVCSPKGFRACGVTAGLKISGNRDLAMITSDVPAQVAGAFTQNSFAAAPVLYCREICAAGKPVRALVANSGNANACTGRQGMTDARNMANLTADKLDIEPEEVLIFSTGRIGVPLPMDTIATGIEKATKTLHYEANAEVAEAIMTTDTEPKSIAVSLDIGGKTVTIGGAAKGAGMIAPLMKLEKEKHATMFCFITTDAVLETGVLAGMLDNSLNQSFNRITVDGDTSTNDSFVALANGLAENQAIRAESVEAERFQQAFIHVAAELAKWLVRDGEGVSHVVELNVTGARSNADAEACARAIGNSLLCKTAWFGADPNWGRILDAAGYSGVDIDPQNVSLDYEGVAVVRNGVDAGEPEEKLAELMRVPEFHIDLDLGAGNGEFTIWTCDLSYDYVKINADYHT